MKTITTLHREAMSLADLAVIARTNGDSAQAIDLSLQAFQKESEAASLVAGDISLEPTRSVLHRSAASLALECGEVREAERLIAVGLAGNPPDEIAEELRDLLEDVYFKRHLMLRGVTLQDDEFQLSLEGNSVGFGIAPSDIFVERVQTIETMLYRTAERHLKRPFRESGRRRRKLAEDFELYVSVPRAASFAVTFKVGKSDQMSLPGLDFGREVINDFLECIDLLSNGEVQKLEEKIPDESYFRNFVGLAQKIAPDGDEVRTVGFTTLEGGKEKRVAMSRSFKKTPTTKKLASSADEQQFMEVKGNLLAADARKQKDGSIEIIDDDGKSHHIRVPRGMMGDIVRPMFEERVVVRGLRKKSQVILDSIELDKDA